MKLKRSSSKNNDMCYSTQNNNGMVGIWIHMYVQDISHQYYTYKDRNRSSTMKKLKKLYNFQFKTQKICTKKV